MLSRVWRDLMVALPDLPVVWGWWWDAIVLAQLQVIFSVVGAVVAAAALYYAWRVARRQFNMLGKQDKIIKKQLALMKRQAAILRRVEKVEKSQATILQRQAEIAEIQHAVIVSGWEATARPDVIFETDNDKVYHVYLKNPTLLPIRSFDWELTISWPEGHDRAQLDRAIIGVHGPTDIASLSIMFQGDSPARIYQSKGVTEIQPQDRVRIAFVRFNTKVVEALSMGCVANADFGYFKKSARSSIRVNFAEPTQ